MRMKWLAILAVLLLAACNDAAPETGSKPGDTGAADHDHDHGDGDKDHDHADGDKDHAINIKKTGLDSPTIVTQVAFTFAIQEKDQKKPKAAPQEDDDEDDKEEQSIKEQVTALKKEYSKMMSQYRKGMREEGADRDELFKEFSSNTKGLFDKAFELANENLEDSEAVSALVWVATSQAAPELQRKATSLALEHFIDSKEIATLVRAISRSQSEDTEATIKKVIEASPHDEVKASATYSLARFYTAVLRSQEYAKTNEEYKPSEFVLEFDPDSANIESLYESLEKNYADLKAPRGTYGEIAKRALFEIRYLSIGKVAPDIAGKDLDGVAFKLSDYRGKVVVIDFWGDW